MKKLLRLEMVLERLRLLLSVQLQLGGPMFHFHNESKSISASTQLPLIVWQGPYTVKSIKVSVIGCKVK